MATYDFRKLGDVEALESVPENANALVEIGGDIKRVPGSNLGGGGGIPTAILKMDTGGSDGKSVASLRESRASEQIYTATCDNMTFAEVKALLLAGEPVSAFLCSTFASDGYRESLRADATFGGYMSEQGANESMVFAFQIFGDETYFYWYPDDHITTDDSYGQGGEEKHLR